MTDAQIKDGGPTNLGLSKFAVTKDERNPAAQAFHWGPGCFLVQVSRSFSVEVPGTPSARERPMVDLPQFVARA